MNFDQICRTCLSVADPMVPIFGIIDDETFMGKSIVDVLNSISKILVFYNDQLPEQICSSCFDELKRAQSFKLKSQRSEQTLREYLNKKSLTLSDSSQNVCVKEEIMDDDPIYNSDNRNAYFNESSTSNDQYNIPRGIHQSSDENNELEEGEEPSIMKYEIDEYGNSFEQPTVQESLKTTTPDAHNSIESNLDEKPDELKTYKCPKCLEVFDQPKILQTHILVSHTDELLCNICDKALKNHSQLRKHCMRHVPLIYSCKQCDKKFKQLDYLNLHIRRHSEIEKKYKCSFCDKLFLNSNELKIHMPAHSAECPFVCDICGLKYKRKDARDTHRTKHTGERSIQCDICLKVCLSSYKLSVHKRSHTGEKPFACKLCEKKFTQRSSLTVHTRIHTNERPYVCPYCSATFRQNSTITEHIRRVHKDQPPVPREHWTGINEN